MGRSVVWWLPAVLALVPLPGWAQAQIQLSCGGAVVEARGSAELKRPTQRLRFSLALEAEDPSSDGALASLQRRLAEVRRRLQALQVSDLQVTSPSTWKRPASRGLPELVQASLQVSGQLAPAQLQSLVRQVGGLPGVRLSPVAPEADGAGDRSARRQLLRAAYQDALQQAQDVAAAMGLRVVQPLEVQLDGGARPVPLRAMALADGSVPPFDPAELPGQTDRLSLQARFCAR
ncbi:SIMPL domain-containing protein [Cyanobium sp. Aljojuca 7D2]|jgi:uncharacterized protein YggE|nr:SIMPL domain-containing protein [Cyanobium sp. Aljojuca 7D2]